MKKKTRININTSLQIYLKTIISFIFNKGNKYEKIFINKLRKLFLTNNILLTSQGRVAAYNIFKVVVSKKKKEILISPYTLTEVVNAIIYAGGKPIYVDIDIKTGLPLEYDLNRKINSKTAGLLITHLYSKKKDIIKFYKKFNKKIIIIEDVAINFGAKINNKKYLGNIFDFGFYSFGVMKNICSFHGGAIYSKDKLKFNQIKKNLDKNVNYPFIESLKLVSFCVVIDFLYNKLIYNFFTHYVLKFSIKKLDRLVYPGVYPKIYRQKPISYNYKFQKNFAIAGIENLKVYDSKLSLRIKNVKIYENYLNKKLLINKFNYYKINSFLEYPILLKNTNNKFLSSKLLHYGYDIRHTWYVNSVRYLKLKCNAKNFPNCEILHDKILSLPTNNNFSKKDIIKICSIINYYEQNKK